jgi:hypothetical protein
MLKTSWHNKTYDFSIFRIVGGDLTPRDNPGVRLDMLEFILRNEKDFPRTHKGWVLNAVPDMEYRRKMENLLHDYKQYFIVLPMARKLYLAANNRNQKIVHAIPINKARNLAITHGKNIARFTVVLDGDCFFDEDTWHHITSKIRKDQIGNNIKYYGIPHTRSSIDHILTSNQPLGPLSEPMPVFRDDSSLRFDENIPFGNGDKQRLLYQLGYSQDHFKQHILENQNLCKTFGYVHHLATGDEEIELSLKKRIEVRNISIDSLLHKLDTFVPPIRKPNEYWKNIHGWFDYQGLYSHLIFTAPENATFVEVGSWLGASMCYAATEAKNREKTINFYAVDTWCGTPETSLVAKVQEYGGNEGMIKKFMNHMKNAGVQQMITPLPMTSIEASSKFKDESIDCVFIDASHSYEDVKNDIKYWYPKIKKSGIIAGHDYVPGHPESDIGVVKAVNEFFKFQELEIGPAGRTWLHRKK